MTASGSFENYIQVHTDMGKSEVIVPESDNYMYSFHLEHYCTLV
jgi:hypothetical protein